MAAKTYLITNGDRFLFRNRQRKYVQTMSESMADTFTKEQAERVLNNEVAKSIRASYYVSRCGNVKEELHTKPPTKEEMRNNSESVFTESVQIWVDKLNDLNGLADEALKRKEKLVSDLSHVDKELADIRHYIEFTKLNACQGYKAYSMEKERLRKRRLVKNELVVVSIILDKKVGGSMTGEIKRRIEGLDKRKYEPRVLQELFSI